MCKLIVVLISFSCLQLSKSVPIKCTVHSTYSIQFEDADTPNLPGHDENKFFFNSDTQKTLNMRMALINGGAPADAEMIRLNDSGVLPSALVANRSYHTEFTLNSLENIAGFGNGWQFTLTREQLTTRTVWMPKESFGLKIEMKRSNVDKVTGCVVLVDTKSEPILQWDLGARVGTISQAEADVGSKVFMRTSTCTNDVAVIGFQTLNPTTELFIGVTNAGFAPGSLQWFSLPASSICNGECTELQLFDMTLTNGYLFLATNLALYRSNQLTNYTAGTPGQLVSWTKDVFLDPGQLFTSGSIGYTAVCQWRHHDVIRDDFVTFSYKSNAPGGTITTTLYSWAPFTNFVNPLLPNSQWLLNNIGPNNVEILSAQYHDHTHNLVMLATIQNGAPLAPTGDDAPNFVANDFLLTTTHVISVPLDEFTNVTKTKLNFPIYTMRQFKFPDEEFPTELTYIPGYYILFAYGDRNVYGSENGGGSWSLYYKTGTNDFTHQIVSCKAQGIFAILTFDSTTVNEAIRYVIYMGRAGVPRLNPMQPNNVFNSDRLNWLFIDSLGTIYVIVQQKTDGTYTKTAINIVSETNRISEVNFPTNFYHGLAIAYMGGGELVALEHRDYRYLADDTETYFQRPRHLNRLFSSDRGGRAILKSISYDKMPHPDYLARLKFHVLQPFPLSDSSQIPSLQLPLRIEAGIIGYDGNAGAIPNQDDSIYVTLTLVSVRVQALLAWRDSELGMTIITQEATYFITVRNTRFTGIMTAFGKRLARVGPGMRQTVEKPVGEWNMIPVSGHDPNFNSYIIRESECRHLVSVDGINNDIYVLDITEGFQFTATTFSNGLPIVEKDSNIVASITNPYLLRTTPKLETFGYPLRQQLTYRAKSVIFKKGSTAIRVRSTRASLLCESAVSLIEVYAGCPCNRYLKFNYPYQYTAQELLTGNPVNELGQALFFKLEANYRPPSDKGVMIPTSDNMYNVDPQKPRPRNEYKISKTTGTLKQCSGAETRAQCGCDDEARVEDDPVFSDCKERVYRLIYPGKLKVQFVIKTLGRPDHVVGSNLAVKVTEVNERRPKFNTKDAGNLLPLLESDDRFNATNYFNPADLEIVMNASGLFHYKAEMIPGLSFCPMTDFFMVYVDEPPLPYPMNHIIFFSTTFVIGFVLFAVFLMHLAWADSNPKRSTGPQCPPLSDMARLQGKFKPPGIPKRFRAKSAVSSAVEGFFGRKSATPQPPRE